MRFELVETKVAIAQIHNFTIKPTDSTPVPEKMIKDVLGYKVSSEIKLKFILRT